MATYPKLRCPMCGMVVWLRNLARKHNLDVFKIHLEGDRKIWYEKVEAKGDLRAFWIRKLKEVTAELECEAMPVTVSHFEVRLVNLSTIGTINLSQTEENGIAQTGGSVVNYG